MRQSAKAFTLIELMNAASTDGAVVRFNNVRSYDDERMGYAPVTPGHIMAGGSYAGREGTVNVRSRWINVPVR